MEPEVQVFDGFAALVLGWTCLLFGKWLQVIEAVVVSLVFFAIALYKFTPLCARVIKDWRSNRE